MFNASSRHWRHGLAALLVLTIAGALWAVDGYPAIFTPFDGGMGTESSPWQISTAGQLVAIDSSDTYLEASFILIDDIDFDDIDDEQFIGIGAADRPFSGHFDGNGHSIENFSLRVSDQHGVGLFRFSQGTIEALEMLDVSIEGDETNMVGSLVGSNNRGEIIDTKATGSVTGERNVGGLVGINWGTLAEVQGAGSISAVRNAGGLVGHNTDLGELHDARASVNVVANRDVGGIVGINEGRINVVVARGDVTGEQRVGGLVGSNYERTEVREGRATGDVAGQRDVGGIVGQNYGIVDTGRADGDVTGEQNVGGFVGSNVLDGHIIAAQADGDVTGEQQVGGFVGSHRGDGLITRSYSTGAVVGDDDVGGFAGFVFDPDHSNYCYWNIDTAGIDTSAAGIGLTTEQFSAPENFEGFAFCPGDDCRWVIDDDEQRPVLRRFAP